ncbi:hypothetical protein ALC60_06013 [Trachymyrmex zeteki]|uniref:Uncharacterized protein n=1 Tax=Mycetomoellerius zeteki TaxID=64791 RepID=A0A151X410_9HYME|nr:hypothetical protein ALC60_06013 [Trachymyrmex zeteki]
MIASFLKTKSLLIQTEFGLNSEVEVLEKRSQIDPTGTRLSNLQIRVVNAFRQGLDTRYGEHSSTTLAEVLRKQSSLSKRLSQTSSIEYADNIPDELTIPEIDVERLSSHSHTETAV